MEGTFKGEMLYFTMMYIDTIQIIDFLEYINARPELYAGYTWKFSEIFATWLAAGAPKVLKEK